MIRAGDFEPPLVAYFPVPPGVCVSAQIAVALDFPLIASD